MWAVPGDFGLISLDDIDALVVIECSNTVLFSLAPGSPSFNGIHSPGDILRSVKGSGTFSILRTAEQLQLRNEMNGQDNVDAIALPEPSGLLGITAGAGFLAIICFVLSAGACGG
jgi:hypothetical protein